MGLAIFLVRVGFHIGVHVPADYFQALGIEPRLLSFGVFIEARDVKVVPVPMLVAHNFNGANQLFFRHDCSFAAIAADFEGGRGVS